MQENISLKNRISFKLTLILIGLFIPATLVYCYYSYVSISAAYRNFFNEKILLANRIIKVQIHAEKVEKYIARVSGNEEFKKMQAAFYEAREELRAMKLERGTPDRARKDELERLVKEFYRECEKFKGDEYYHILQQLDGLKKASGAQYVYIFADTGVKDMYTYIFDAGDAGTDTALDEDGLGTVETHEYFGKEASEIFSTGEPMREAVEYVNDLYGPLFFAYAPLLDENGKTIAVVGTDISGNEMYRQINTMIMLSVLVFLFLTAVVVLAVWFFFRSSIAKPINAIKENAARVSNGDVYAPIPKTVLALPTELGLLARAVHSMSAVYQNMISSTEDLFEAAIVGRLDVRNDPSRFNGDISRVIEQINGTLDAIILYLNSMHEAMFIAGPHFEMMFFNKRFNELFGGMPPADFFRAALPDFAGLDDADLYRQVKLLLVEGSFSATVWLATGGKGQACFAVTVSDIMPPGSNQSNMLALAADVTDLMLEKEKAQAASVAKSEFLSRISHELRTPMNVIIGMATLGLNGDKEQAIERFKAIDAASRQLLNIINDVLDMSRIESGKMEIYNDSFRLCSLLEECGELFRLQAEEKGIRLDVVCGPDIPPMLRGDSRHLRQILINLLGNAMKFTNNGGKTEAKAALVRQDGANARILFSVNDTGIGMSADFLKRIFSPFEQEDVYLQRRYVGTGLGLTICKNLVELMGGAISVESEPGRGSRFSFELAFTISDEEPETAESGETCADSGADFTALAGMKIMLVDDIEINRMILMEMLEPYNIQITEAGDGAEAVRLFENSAPGAFDLIFMDIQMPELNGYDATRRLRALPRPDARKIPIVAMTANALQQDADLAIASGMNGHISKPIDLEYCLNVLRRYNVTRPCA